MPGHASPVLITGGAGMVGSACTRLLGEQAISLDITDLDISDRDAVVSAVRRLRPRIVINCAAATNVDACEMDGEFADRANHLGPGYLAEAAAEVGARMVHLSTDFVFAGDKGGPYREHDRPQPINYYGLSKLRGEEAVREACPNALLVRTSWVYGHNGLNFPLKVLEWAREREELRIVNDQYGSPTFAEHLAYGILCLLGRGVSGLVHLAGSGCASRFDVAREVIAAAGLDTGVVPASSGEFPLPARRPAMACLDCSLAESLGVRLPDWREGVQCYVRSLHTGCLL